MQEAPVEVVTVLLAAGADPDQVDCTGCTALHAVCRFRTFHVSGMLPLPELRRLLLSVVGHDSLTTRCAVWVQDNFDQLVRALLVYSVSADKADENGLSALQTLCLSDDVEVSYLLARWHAHTARSPHKSK